MRSPIIKSFLFICFFLTTTFAFAQKEANYWYFGNRAGLWFPSPTAPPMYRTDSWMKALEGSATISDSLGNLLFYTAGDTVFNRFHIKMNNGWPLTGHQSASQSAIIVEQPYTNLHYLFVVDALGGANSLKYSVINASANNLAGTVLAKNLAVPNAGPQFPVSEKITAVDHRYSRDAWVIAHGSGTQNDNFYAYRLTSTGIMPPVVSRTGISHVGSYPNYNTIGYMKASPDGRKLALAMQEQHLIEIYDFNDSSGVVSNPIRLTGLPRPYGIEFSRDGSKLYVSVEGSTALIQQFNLEAGGGHPDSIYFSRKTIGVTKSIYSPALQLSNNGKIYVANTELPPGNRFLSVINSPDSAVQSVHFTTNTQALSASAASLQRSSHGLPNFNQSYLWLPSFRAKYLCMGDQTLFNSHLKRKIKNVLWQFGDPDSGPANMSTDLNPTHQFARPGTYFVTLTVTLLNNRLRAITIPIIINPLPTVNLGPDQEICKNGTLVLYGTQTKDKHLWSTGSTDSAITISQPGIYWLEIKNVNNCVSRDTIEIKPATRPDNYFYKRVVDTCPFRPVRLEPSRKLRSYYWSTGSTDSAIMVTREGWYKLTSQFRGCDFTDSVQVVFKNCPEDFEVPNVVTPNGDNANDKFQLAGYRVGSFSLKIFNRWGQLVFESAAYKNNWPTQKQAAGVFYYQLQNLESKKLYKGWLEVID